MVETPEVQARLDALSEFCVRQGFDASFSWATQREPENIVAIRVGGLVLRSESTDSIAVALARAEAALLKLGRAGSDVYLHSPARTMGGLA